MADKKGMLRIGELARRTRTTDATLRYYERLGLLSVAERVNGRRRYGAESAEQVALVRLCQDAGFTLREIGDFLRHKNRPGRGWSHLAERKLRELDTRIADAERARQLLQHALSCSSPNLFECPRFRSAVATHLVPASDSEGTRTRA